MEKQSSGEIGFWQGILNVVALVVLGTALIALKAYVILSLANLYGIEMIVKMSFVQVLGVLGIISLFLYRDRKKEENMTAKEEIMAGWHSLIKRTIYILLCWGIGYAMFSIF